MTERQEMGSPIKPRKFSVAYYNYRTGDVSFDDKLKGFEDGSGTWYRACDYVERHNAISDQEYADIVEDSDDGKRLIVVLATEPKELTDEA